MRAPWSNLEGPARLLVICLTILLVASGLCDLQLLITNGGNGGTDSLAIPFIILGFIELGVMLISAFVGASALVAWILTLFGKSSSRSGDTK